MWTVARGYLRAPLCDVFADLFDEIGVFWYVSWTEIGLLVGEVAQE